MADWWDAPVGTRVATEATAPPTEPAPGDGDMVAVVYPNGTAGTVRRSELRDAIISHGARLEGEGETDARATRKRAEGHQLRAGIESFASTATFGGTDLLAGALAPEHAQEMREIREHNIAGSLVGGVAGAFTGAGGLASAAGGAAERGVASVAGKGLGARVLGAGARGATEGAIFGAGMGVSEVGLSKDPADWESAAATIGSNVLGGALIGGGLGVGGKLLEEGASAARARAAKAVADIRGEAPAAVDRSAFPEIAEMDRKAAAKARGEQLAADKAARAADVVEGKAAKEAEEAALTTARDESAAQALEEAKAYVEHIRPVKINVDDLGDRAVAKRLGQTKLGVMKGLNNEAGFIRARGAGKFQSALEEQASALKSALADADEVMATASRRQMELAESLPKAKAPLEPDLYGSLTAEQGIAREAEFAKNYLTPQQAKLYAEFSGIPVPKGKSIAITAEELAGFRSAVEAGDVLAPEIRRIQQAQHLLERNEQMQARLTELQAPLASEKLREIENRIDLARGDLKPSPRLQALEAHLADISEETVGKKLARAAGGITGGSAGMGLGGPIGAAAGGMMGQDVGARLYERLVRKLNAGNAARGQSIKASVARMFSTAVEKTAAAVKKAAPIASRVLPAVRYAEKSYVDGVLGAPNATPSKSELVNEFRARARELNALTMKTATGGFDVRMRARQALNARLAALWAIDPDFANGVEKTHNARLAFLASKLPRDPAPAHLQAGPETWEPSRAQVAKFARFMEAVEQPERVMQRLSTATITPEDAEVLKTVYPQMYEQARGQVMDHMAELRHRLPYEKRLALSIYLDVPVDPAVTPEAITVYQGLYAQDQAQQQAGAGSGAAPRPSKPFTSSEKPTAGQRAAEG